MTSSTNRFRLYGCCGALGAIALLVIGLIGWTGSGLLDLSACENNVKQEVLSPDGQKKIVVFSRDGGATTGVNSQATILRVGDKLPDQAGSVFITDKDDVTVKWDGPTRIRVSMKGYGEDFLKENSVMGIAIVYE